MERGALGGDHVSPLHQPASEQELHQSAVSPLRDPATATGHLCGGAIVCRPTVRPLVLGYLRIHSKATDESTAHLRNALTTFAESRGFSLAEIFTQPNDIAPTVLPVLVEALDHSNAQGLVVPSLAHFSRFAGVHTAICTLIERKTGARVLVMDHERPDGSIVSERGVTPP